MTDQANDKNEIKRRKKKNRKEIKRKNPYDDYSLRTINIHFLLPSEKEE